MFVCYFLGPIDPEECYTDGELGTDYRGYVSVTVTGNTCQMWTAQSPVKHSRTLSNYPNKGLGEHNYCRNPDNESGGAWCYTTNPDYRWQYCDIGGARPSCSASKL